MTGPLEDGKTYYSFTKGAETIVGPTRINPEWVYSRRGNWYERATGHFLAYNAKTGDHYPVPHVQLFESPEAYARHHNLDVSEKRYARLAEDIQFWQLDVSE